MVPTLHITIHPRKYRRPVVGLDIARQRQRLMRAGGSGLNEGNGRDGLRIRPLHDFLLALRAANEAIADDDARQQDRRHGGGQ